VHFQRVYMRKRNDVSSKQDKARNNIKAIENTSKL
jgi:hypothetical protein